MDLMLRGLTTKYSHWRYEKEVRAMINLDERDAATSHYFVDFSDDLMLREIIVGATSALSRAKLQDALREMSQEVKLMKARLAFRSFRVVRQRDDRMWK